VGTYGYVLSCLALNVIAYRGPSSSSTNSVLTELSGVTARAGFMPSQLTRSSYSGLAGGEIIFTHGHRDWGKDRFRSGPVLVPFRLVVPPL
jgi:hypothetical protein